MFSTSRCPALDTPCFQTPPLLCVAQTLTVLLWYQDLPAEVSVCPAAVELNWLG